MQSIPDNIGPILNPIPIGTAINIESIIERKLFIQNGIPSLCSTAVLFRLNAVSNKSDC